MTDATATVRVNFHHKDSGLFTGNYYQGHPDTVAMNTPKDHVAYIGRVDHLSQRMDIETGKLIDYQPPSPSPSHEWNASSRRWQPSTAARAKATAATTIAARIATLEASQLTWLRKHALGDPKAIGHLREIDDEIAVLTGDL